MLIKNNLRVLLLSVLFSLGLSGMSYADEAPPSQRVTKNGVIFNLDMTYPSLGAAYRDPSGLIWGTLLIENNRVTQTDFATADSYCKSIGARLPTLKEYIQFARDLGAGYWTGAGYSPNAQDGMSVLLGLPYYWYWTSTPYWFQGAKFQYIFWGDSGEYQDGIRTSKGGAVRCVIRP